MRWSTWCCPPSRCDAPGLPFTWSCLTRHSNNKGSTNASTDTSTTGNTAATISETLDEFLFLRFFGAPKLFAFFQLAPLVVVVTSRPAIADCFTRAIAVAAAVENDISAPTTDPRSTHRGTSVMYHAPVISFEPPPLPFTKFAAWNSPRSPLRAVCDCKNKVSVLYKQTVGGIW